MSPHRRAMIAATVLVLSLAATACSGDSTASSADDPGGATATSAAERGAGEQPTAGGADASDDATEPDDETAEMVRTETDDYLRVAAESLEQDSGRSSMDEVATGSALDAAMAQAAEFADNGWQQTGAPRIVESRIVKDERDEDPQRVVVLACVDSSEVDVVDDEGNSVRHGNYPDRSRMLFTLVRDEDRWLVSEESFPANPDC